VCRALIVLCLIGTVTNRVVSMCLNRAKRVLPCLTGTVTNDGDGGISRQYLRNFTFIGSNGYHKMSSSVSLVSWHWYQSEMVTSSSNSAIDVGV
jgi:hypothetical protein